MKLSVGHLIALTQVADTGGFTRAAQVLHISQPALSQRVADAERLLNVQLFDRSRRTVVITPVGERVVREARKALGAFDRGLERVYAAAGHPRSTMHVAALPSLAAVVLPPAMREVHSSIQGINISVTAGHSKLVLDMVDSGACDFGVSTLDVSGLETWSAPILEDTFVALLPSDLGYADKASISWEDLTKERFILPPMSSSLHSIVLRTIAETGHAPKNTSVGGEVALTAGLVAAGLGVTVIPRLTLPLVQFADVTIMEIDGPPIYRTIHCIAPSADSLDTAALAMIDAIKNVAAAR